jgi:hypothetical protein
MHETAKLLAGTEIPEISIQLFKDKYIVEAKKISSKIKSIHSNTCFRTFFQPGLKLLVFQELFSVISESFFSSCVGRHFAKNLCCIEILRKTL